MAGQKEGAAPLETSRYFCVGRVLAEPGPGPRERGWAAAAMGPRIREGGKFDGSVATCSEPSRPAARPHRRCHSR